MGKIQRIQNKTKPKKQKHIKKTFKKQTENVLSLSVSLQNESAAVLTVLELAALQWLDVSRLSPKNIRRISSCTVLSHLHVTYRHHLWHSITWVIARQAQYLTCSDFQPTCPPLNHQKCFRTIVWKLWFRYFSISSSPTPSSWLSRDMTRCVSTCDEQERVRIPWPWRNSCNWTLA